MLITHKLDEALRAADRVTVLRAGRVTLTGPASAQTPDSLARAMIGSGAPVHAGPRPAESVERASLIRCEMLDLPREDGRGLALRGASLTVAAGELVGIAAVEGSGQRELLRTIAGLARPLRGRLEVAAPVAFVPEDRTTEGLIGELALTDNVVLGLGRGAPWVHRNRLDWKAARERTSFLIRQFGIRASGPDAPAGALSGGNQQKLLIARALELAPRVIVAENPTRGLDIHAADDVWQRLARGRGRRRGGAGVFERSGRSAGAGRPRRRRGRRHGHARAGGGREGGARGNDAGWPARRRGMNGIGSGLRAGRPRLRSDFCCWPPGSGPLGSTPPRPWPPCGGGVRLLVRLHVRDAGAGGAADRHRARHRGRVPGRTPSTSGRKASSMPARSRRPGSASTLGGSAPPLAIPRGLACGSRGRRAVGARCRCVLRLRFGVLEVISTLLLNFVAEALVSWMVQGPLQEAKHIYPQSDPIAAAARLPLLPGTRLHLGFLAGIALAVVVWYVFRRTVWGFRLLAAGAGPRAARVSGRIDVGRVTAARPALVRRDRGARRRTRGGRESPTRSSRTSRPGTASPPSRWRCSRGSGRWASCVTGIVFGALEAGAQAMQREAGVPAVAVYVVEAVIILVLLLAEATGRRARTAWRYPTRRRTPHEPGRRGRGPGRIPGRGGAGGDAAALRGDRRDGHRAGRGDQPRARGRDAGRRARRRARGERGSVGRGCGGGARGGGGRCGVRRLGRWGAGRSDHRRHGGDARLRGAHGDDLPAGVRRRRAGALAADASPAPGARAEPHSGDRPGALRPAGAHLCGLALVPVVWWMLFRTRVGLALRATGEARDLARAAGVPVGRLRFWATVFGGALAGLAVRAWCWRRWGHSRSR